MMDRDFYIAVIAPTDGWVNRGGNTDYPVEKGEEVHLRYGQSVKFGNLRLKYADVNEDNRPVLRMEA